MSQIDEVSRLLGSLEAQMKTHNDRLASVIDELRAQQSVSADLVALKNKGVGLLLGAGLVGGATGAWMKTLITKFFG